ncbi:MAG: ABC transporter ATP-binding protein [Lachnospiraceae bacterium]
MKQKESRSTVQVLLKLLVLVKPLVLPMIIAVLTGVLGFLCASFITIGGGYAVLVVLGVCDGLSLRSLCTILVVCAISRGILHYIEHACNHYIAFKLLAHIRDRVYAVLRRLAPAKLEGIEKGNLIALVTSDIELLEIFFAHTISPICIAVIMVSFMASFIGSYHVILGVVAGIAYLVIGCVIPIIASTWTKKLGEEQRKDFGDMNSYYLDSIRGMKEIKQFDQGETRLESIYGMSESMEQTSRKLKEKTGFVTALTNSCVLGFSVMLCIVACMLYQNGSIKLDAVVIPTLALFSSFGAVIALANLGTGLAQTIACGNRILDLLEEQPAIEEKLDGMEAEIESVLFDQVDFSYGEEKILEQVSLGIEAKKITGIMGKSGTGKSTLLKLIMRFWDVDDGSVLLGGVDVRNINTSCLRENQSFVTQTTHLFHDTIYENVRIAKLDATLEEVVEACQKASIHNFIMGLPKQYNTPVGELGDTLSGGERQRIGLARAFLHDASCMLLDEPTSNLDSLNEAIILKSLKQDLERTIVLVSHRASTMVIADSIIEMNRINT